VALVGLALAVFSGCSGDDGAAGSDASAAAHIVKQAPLLAVMGSGGPGYITDADGREVLLRGVNVNSYAEYWHYDKARPAVLAFTADDHRYIAGLGYNLVRLLITWSRVEPEPGKYDDAYLDEVGAVIEQLHAQGIYTLIDMHQDAWGPHVAAPPGTVCKAPMIPAGGWDGAPRWATLIDPSKTKDPYCLPKVADNYIREFVPVVRQAWRAMFDNANGPGGVGLQDRFAAMWAHVAERIGGRPGVMGYDVINEPNAMFGADEFVALKALYIKAFTGIRAGEKAAGIAPRIIVFEPGANWAIVAEGATVEKFSDDPQQAYGPHIYQGSIAPQPLDAGQVERLRKEATALGGVPIICGEWGASPTDAAKPDNYFRHVLRLADDEHWSLAHWVYQSACGDPHNYAHDYPGKAHGKIGSWAYRQVDCDTPDKAGAPYAAMVGLLQRPAVHFAPGRIGSLLWDPDKARMVVTGKDAAAGNALELFVPANHAGLKLTVTGLGDVAETARHGGRVLKAPADGGSWSVTLQ